MSESSDFTSSENDNYSLPSLHVDADTTERDDSSSGDNENVIFVGNVPPYRFEPVHHTDSESDDHDEFVVINSQEAEDRQLNTDW
jgi:hypothetical protein